MKTFGSKKAAQRGQKKRMKKSRRIEPTNQKMIMGSRSLVYKKIEQSFKFEAVRKFPMGDDVVYSPDYILTQTRNGKKIVIHVDISIVDTSASTYKTFMKMFKNVYYVIMVVSENQLRRWNEEDENRQVLFDEIWTVNNVDDMIESIRNLPRVDIDSILATCSVCHKQAKGIKKIKNNFAYRTKSDGSLTIHPRCRKCQKNMYSRRVRLTESTVRCIGCGTSFRSKIISQIYCNLCESNFLS